MLAKEGCVCQKFSFQLNLLVRALVAQRLEQQTHNLLVVGSNPTEGISILFLFAFVPKKFQSRPLDMVYNPVNP